MNAAKTIGELLQNFGQLPTLPKAVIEIIRCIDDTEITVQDLVKLIGSDIGLSTRLLRAANSARVSVHGNIASINDAVMIIGLKQIREIACTVGVKESFPLNKSTGLDYINFWRHSLGVAICAKTLAHIAGVNPAVGYISGMLHDIGQLVVSMVAPNEFREAMEYRASHHCQDYEAEQLVLGMDHAQIGAYLATHWGLPRVICVAIEKHHIPDTAPTAIMADLIHVSEILSHALEMGYIGHPIPPLSERSLSRLGINFTRLKPYLAQIECEHRNAMLMLN